MNFRQVTPLAGMNNVNNAVKPLLVKEIFVHCRREQFENKVNNQCAVDIEVRCVVHFVRSLAAALDGAYLDEMNVLTSSRSAYGKSVHRGCAFPVINKDILSCTSRL